MKRTDDKHDSRQLRRQERPLTAALKRRDTLLLFSLLTRRRRGGANVRARFFLRGTATDRAPVQGPESRAAIQPVGAALGLRPGPPISPHSPGLAVNRSPDLRISTLYSIIFLPPPGKKQKNKKNNKPSERDAASLAAASRSAEEPFKPVRGPN